MAKPITPVLNTANLVYSDPSGATMAHAYLFYENGGTTVHDLVGSINGTATGTMAWATGPYGNPLGRFADGASYVTLASTFTAFSGAYSVAWRAPVDAGTTTHGQPWGSAGNPSGYCYQHPGVSAGVLNITTHNTTLGSDVGAQWTGLGDFTSLTDSYVATFDGVNSCKLYKNGTLVASPTAALYSFPIAYLARGTATSNILTGNVDYVYFYGGVLSAAQIAALNTDPYQFANDAIALTAGTTATSGGTNSSVGLTTTLTRGGTAPYTFQYQQAPDVSGSPGTWANVGASFTQVATKTISGLTAGTKYWFRCVVTDSAGTPATANSTAVSYTPPADTITLTSPKQYQVFQRNGSDQADISISGTYSGSVTSIEASWNGGAYTTIVPTPSGGTFTGTLAAQAKGQGTLSVRFANNTTINASVGYVGIGDVYVIAGQSNAEGWMSHPQSCPGTFKPGYFREDGAWTGGNDPTDTGTNTGSYWPLLGALIQADQSCPAGFITCATGGTSLLDLTSPPNAIPVTSTWKVGAVGYNRVLSQVPASGVNAVKAIIYYQGEADSGGEITRSAYNTALTAMANGWASGLASYGSPKTVVCVFGKYNDNATSTSDDINQAQIDGWNAGGNILPGSIILDVSNQIHPTTNSDPDTDGAIISARLWKSIYGTSKRGPRIVSAAADATKKIITVKFDQALATGLTFDNALWSIADAGGAKTVVSVAYHPTDSTAVNVTLSTALGTSPTLGYSLRGTSYNGDGVLNGLATQGLVGPRSASFTVPGAYAGFPGTQYLPAEPVKGAAITLPAVTITNRRRAGSIRAGSRSAA